MESVMYRRPWILFFLTCVEALRTDKVVGGANKAWPHHSQEAGAVVHRQRITVAWQLSC